MQRTNVATPRPGPHILPTTVIGHHAGVNHAAAPTWTRQAIPRRFHVSTIILVVMLFVFAGVLCAMTVGAVRDEPAADIVTVTLGVLSLAMLGLAVLLATAYRLGADAKLSVDADRLRIHSRGVLVEDLDIPLADLREVFTYPRGYGASEMREDGASFTPESSGPWLVLVVESTAVPARSYGWAWNVLRVTDYTHVETPVGDVYELLMFGTDDAEALARHLREGLNA